MSPLQNTGRAVAPLGFGHCACSRKHAGWGPSMSSSCCRPNHVSKREGLGCTASLRGAPVSQDTGLVSQRHQALGLARGSGVVKAPAWH